MAKGDYLNKCDVCGKPADGPMLSPMFAHSDCVIRKLNELLDPDYDNEGEPEKIVGYIAQACAEERAKVLSEVIGWMRKNSSEPLTKAGLFQVVVTTDELLKQLKKWGIKSGQMPATVTKIKFEGVRSMPPFYGRGKNSLKQKPIIRSSEQRVKK